MTLYQDGQNFQKESELVNRLIQLLEHGLSVAIVTAAAYGNLAEGYEKRLSGLLDAIIESPLTQKAKDRFFVFGIILK